MIRSFAAGLLVSLTAATGAFAQSCAGDPVAVQILGSGAPGFVKDRANASYLVWVGNQAKILLDTGGGAYIRFSQSQARFGDLSVALISHLHPDHISDLPALLWSGRILGRRDALPIVGPTGNDTAPGLSTFLDRQFDPKSGAFEVLGSINAKTAGNAGFRLEASEVDVTKQEATTVFDHDGIKVTALGIPHGPLPTLAYRVETKGKTIVFSSDQTGTNPRFPAFAKGADILVMHLAVGVGGNNPIQAQPAVVGSVAQSAAPKRLILSHIANFDLDVALADVKKNYTGQLTVGADLQCTPVP